MNASRTVPAGALVARVAAVMRAVAAAPGSAATTSEIARATDLPRPTVHRLLSSLMAEGLLDRDTDSGRWTPGPELFLFGAAAAPRFDVAGRARDIVRRLADQTGESAFLSARRGDETVCLLREDGSFPLRSHVLHEGIRFPLGVASAGLAILAFLAPAERDAYLHRAELTGVWGPDHDAGSLAARVREVQETGFAINPGLIVEGSWGLGAAVFDRSGSPAWALSLTGVETRFRADRIPELGRTLLGAAHELTQRLTADARR
jgi:DNA-binding IclR family transcriptional regulator